MNILITGNLGHIGSSLLENINKIKKLNKVYLIDSLRSNNVNVLFNLKFKKKVNVKFIKADLIEMNKINQIKDKIDVIIHCASITDAAGSFSIKKLLEYLKIL